MKEIHSIENGLAYTLYCHETDDNHYGREKTFQIGWHSDGKIIQLQVEYGTLIRDTVSPDGRYLILVFRNNQQFPEPCNCVVYNLEGKVHKLICAPLLINEEIIKNHEGDKGHIIGSGINKNLQAKYSMVLGIWFHEIARSPYVDCYRESREFDPETGSIGDIISWELPWR